MKKHKKYFRLVIILFISVILVFYSITYAKYISNSVWNYYLKTVGFYFNSDNLDSSVIKNIDNLWSGGSVYFNIKNNLNQNVITNYDINYSATCIVTGEAASYSTCNMNGSGTDTYTGALPSIKSCINNTTDGIDVSEYNEETCILGGYSWVSQISTQDLFFDVVLTNPSYEISDVVVTVTVISTSPYSKTLVGDFTLHKYNVEEHAVTLNYNNYSNYDRLIISNSYSSDKCVKVTWDSSKLMIDAENSNFSSYSTDLEGYINEITFNINAKNNLSYIFYKKDFEEIYNVTEFTIEEITGCV